MVGHLSCSVMAAQICMSLVLLSANLILSKLQPQYVSKSYFSNFSIVRQEEHKHVGPNLETDTCINT